MALWAVAALVIQWRTTAQTLPLSLMAFQGPVEMTSAFSDHWISIIHSLAWLVLFWLAARSIGTWLLEWIGQPKNLGRGEVLPAIHILGFGLYGCLVVGFGLLGLFFRPIAVVKLLVLSGCGLWMTRRTRKGPDHDVRVPRRLISALAIATGGAGLLLAIFSLTPETWSDSLQYHLAAPQDFNKLHKWVDFDQDMYRYPLLAEGIFGQGLLIGGEQLAARLNLSGSLMTLWLLWAWARRIAGSSGAWLAVLSMLASNQVGFHIGQTNQGMHSVAFATFGIWAWTTGGLFGRSVRWSLLTGAGLGWALCAKYTAAAPGFGVLAWHLIRAIRRPRREFRTLWMIAAGAIIAAAPFLANDWLFTNNPVYPLFFGGLNWTPENTRVLKEYGCVGYDFNVHDPRTFISALYRLCTQEQPLLLLALPALVWLRGAIWLPLAVAWGGAVMAWSVGVPCIRLMMPAFPAISITAAAAILPWWESGGRRGWLTRAATVVILVLGVIETIGVTDFNHRSLNAAVGLEPESRYLARILTTYDEATREVNRIVPGSARLLVIGDSRGWRFKPLEYNRDLEDTPVMLDLARHADSAESIRRHFRQMGVRWVLLNYVTSEYLASWWNMVIFWKPVELKRTWEFWRTYADIVWQSPRPDGLNGGYVLYRLRDESGPPTLILPYLPGAEMVSALHGNESPEAYLDRMEATWQIAPDVAFFASRMGAKYLATGRPTDALRIASHAITPDYAERDVLYGLSGLALQRLGRFREAAAVFGTAEALHPAELEYGKRRMACEEVVKRQAQGHSER